VICRGERAVSDRRVYRRCQSVVACSAAGATRMLELSTDMASDRTAERARIVLRRLVDFKDVPEVRAVLAEHTGS
jgi:hypothetical protein